MADPLVELPAHYDADECMKLLEAAGLGRDGCLFNIGKYLYRFSEKGKPVQDCEKARWYARRLQERGFYGKPIARAELDLIMACIEHGTRGLDTKQYPPGDVVHAGFVSGQVIQILQNGMKQC